MHISTSKRKQFSAGTLLGCPRRTRCPVLAKIGPGPKTTSPFCKSDSRWVVPSRERAYFGNHRSEENTLSLKLQPHGFSPVVVGENSRTLPQLSTDGLKRVPRLRIARSASSASPSKFPHARCLLLSPSLPIGTTNLLGAELRWASFMKIQLLF